MKFCKDCPCCNMESGWYENEYQCNIDPPQYCGEDDNGNAFWGYPGVNSDHWCYRGRQIMGEKDFEELTDKELIEKVAGICLRANAPCFLAACTLEREKKWIYALNSIYDALTKRNTTEIEKWVY